MDDTSLVQPIVLRRSGTHENATRAAALASVTAWYKHADDPAWDAWLAQRFTKTVRRARNDNQFATAVSSAPCAAQIINDASAAAFVPVTYLDMPRHISKLQVSNLELPRTAWEAPDRDSGPVLVVNEALPMSTGKTAAQAAHALFAWLLTLTTTEQARWFQTGRNFSVTGAGSDQFAQARSEATVAIRDAGFTEIEAGSCTVVVTT